jgi:hypothetical protein
MSVVVNEFEVVPEAAQPQPQAQQRPEARGEADPVEAERILHELMRQRAARVERLRAT